MVGLRFLLYLSSLRLEFIPNIGQLGKVAYSFTVFIAGYFVLQQLSQSIFDDGFNGCPPNIIRVHRCLLSRVLIIGLVDLARSTILSYRGFDRAPLRSHWRNLEYLRDS